MNRVSSRHQPQHARPSALQRAAATLPAPAPLAGLTAVATVAAVALLPAPAAAEPRPDERALAQRVQALDTQASLAVEEFNHARERVTTLERRVAVTSARAERQEQQVERARAQMADVVAAAYRRGSAHRFALLVTDGDPQAFLDRAAALDRIARSQADLLAQVETTRARAAAEKAAAQRELQALREASAQLAQRKAQVERALAAQQRLLAGVREQERRQAEAARAAASRAAATRASRDRAEAASAPSARSGAPSAAAPAATYNGPASGRAKVAIEEGYRQLGKPYRYGASGPDAFDCSGFTSWVWRKAGVSLPRTSRDQYASGRKVARSDLQPGDLLYFGSPIHHVGMYLGDGKMIHAPSSGKTVHITDVFRDDYVGATRP